MPNQKLTKEQLEKLYHFTRQHYVEYYDLQTELVDHLANAIEAQWQENPKLLFEEALQLEFKKYDYPLLVPLIKVTYLWSYKIKSYKNESTQIF